MTIEVLLARFGLPALLVGAGVEGETVVLLGGLMVHRGLIPYWPAVLAAGIGSFIADQLLFAAGRRLRDRQWVRRLTGTPAFQRAHAAFEKWPTLFVFGFRFVYGIRIASPLAIGTSRIPARRFLVLNALAALLWGFVFVTLGYAFGRAIEAAFGRVKSILLPVIAVAAAAALVALAVRWWRVRRLSPRDT